MRYVWLLVLLTLSLVGCAQVPPSSEGGTFVVESTSRRLHWEADDFPITVWVDSRLIPTAQDEVLRGCEEWNMQLWEAMSTPSIFQCQIGFLPRYLALPGVTPHTIAITTAYLGGYAGLALHEFHDDGVVVRGLVLLNPYNNHEILRTTTIHELGHVLGLAHDPTIQSVMNHSVTDVDTITRRDLFYVHLQTVSAPMLDRPVHE